MRTLARPWHVRRAPFVECIRALDPDVLCLQEVSARRARARPLGTDLLRDDRRHRHGADRAPRLVHADRPAGALAAARFLLGGEWCPILMRRGSFSCLASGSLAMPAPSRAFTPHAVHWVRAQSADSAHRVRDLQHAPRHLAVAGAADRPRAARGPRRQPRRALQILTGDFNSRAGGTLLGTLTAVESESGGGFRDTWAEAERREGGGTFHWGLGLPGPRIDHVLARPARRVARASIVCAWARPRARFGPCPSDGRDRARILPVTPEGLSNGEAGRATNRATRSLEATATARSPARPTRAPRRAAPIPPPCSKGCSSCGA